MQVLILDCRLCDIILFDQLADIDELWIRARPDALDDLSGRVAFFSSRRVGRRLYEIPIESGVVLDFVAHLVLYGVSGSSRAFPL